MLLPSTVHAQKRVALVVSNSAYRHAPELANPKNDATCAKAPRINAPPRRSPPPGPTPYDGANRDRAPPLASAERHDLSVNHIVIVAPIGAGADASGEADPRGRFG